MGWFDVAKDIATMPIEGPMKFIMGGVDTVADLSAGVIDDGMGDHEHAKEHYNEAKWDALSMVPFVGSVTDKYKTAQDIATVGKEEPEAYDPDKTGTGAKWGAILSSFMGPFGMLGGAALGGAIGHYLTPDMKGGGVPNNVGSQLGAIGKQSMLGAGISQNPTLQGVSNALTPNFNNGPTKAMSLKGHPFAHYAD